MTAGMLACEHTLDVGHDRGDNDDSAKLGADGSVLPNEGVSSEAGPTDASAGDASCPAVCEKLLSCGYVDASEVTKCNAQCTATPRSLLDCIAAATCQTLVACAPTFPVFDPPETGSSSSAGTCKAACDNIKFYGCISAADHANCRTLCDNKPEDVLQTFIQCKEATSNCSDRLDCYDQFRK